MYVPKSPIVPFNSAHFDLKAKLFFTFCKTLAGEIDAGAWWVVSEGFSVVSRSGFWWFWDSICSETAGDGFKGEEMLCI